MPRAMGDSERSFQLIGADGVGAGRYLGGTPRDAARKAARRVFSRLAGDVNDITVSLRETTRWISAAQRNQAQHIFTVRRAPLVRKVMVNQGAKPVESSWTYTVTAVDP
jgi:hypothetical protein